MQLYIMNVAYSFPANWIMHSICNWNLATFLRKPWLHSRFIAKTRGPFNRAQFCSSHSIYGAITWFTKSIRYEPEYFTRRPSMRVRNVTKLAPLAGGVMSVLITYSIILLLNFSDHKVIIEVTRVISWHKKRSKTVDTEIFSK